MLVAASYSVDDPSSFTLATLWLVAAMVFFFVGFMSSLLIFMMHYACKGCVPGSVYGGIALMIHNALLISRYAYGCEVCRPGINSRQGFRSDFSRLSFNY